MRSVLLGIALLLAASVAFGQAGTATITGTVTDPTGAAIPNAMIQVKNTDTGVIYSAASTNTGNYTVAQLPVGTYQVTVAVQGFKTYVHSNLEVHAAQVIQENPKLEIGELGESVTTTAEATLLKTETGDIAHNVTVQNLDNLPILGIGGSNSGSSGVRNPYNLMTELPGVDYSPNSTMIVNGAPNNTEGMRIEGQNMTNHFVNFAVQEMQPSPDSIQEVAVQTSNYAAEFGTAGGGLLNITMKSGTNQYHGSAYDYFVNEFLNAGYPFTLDPAGNKYRPQNRRNDYGGTLGGPVQIPKLYNGHDKTFFFFNWEEFLESSTISFPLTLPTAAFRMGDFSAISPNGTCSLCGQLGIPTQPLATDPAGNPVYANEIYDPRTRNLATGTAMRFPNNVIPMNRLDPTSLAIQSLFPQPSNSNLINNGAGSHSSDRTTIIPSLKIDQSIGASGRSKLSFYWSRTATDSQYSYPNGNADGLPAELTNARGTFFHYWVTRLNYDFTATPTLLVHLGGGYNQIAAFDDAPYLSFNAQQQIGVTGFEQNRNFPYISGMCAPAFGGGCGGALGGMQSVGTALGIQGHPYPQEMPTFNANATWVKGSHTFKFGTEDYLQGNVEMPFASVLLTTGTNATSLPFAGLNLQGQSMGFGYASFLLGDYNSIQQSAPADYHLGKQQWALFAQDSWKATRNFTVDYGLRWDWGNAQEEEYGRAGVLGNIPNPSAGGRIGGTIYGATCNCDFTKDYSFGFGPRLGVAYQVTPKTVLRGGWGLIYGFVPDLPLSPPLAGYNVPSGINPFVNLAGGAAIPQPVFPTFDPGVYPLPGTTSSAPTAVDPHAGRPPRQMQYSVGFQRELSKDLVLEASYVGNRGVWWTQAGANLGFLNQVGPGTFSAYGLMPYTNPADDAFLSLSNSAAQVVQKYGGPLEPYAGFHGTVLQALEQYPQFSSATVFGAPWRVTNAPTGDTWYDALQVKLTKRLSYGLQADLAFTWSKALVSSREDFWNPLSSTDVLQPTDQPYILNANFVYTVPRFFQNTSKIVSHIVSGWQIGAFLQYGSGFPLTPPSATNSALNPLEQVNGNVSYMYRVPGQPLYTKDLNCGCINPYFDQVLNPKAWVNPPAGQWGPDALWSDFRGQRRPQENFNFGRNFRLTERVNLQVRAEFVNIFNRTYLAYPSTVNPLAPPAHNAFGQINGGFGTINDTLLPYSDSVPTAPATFNGTCVATGLCGLPRTGTLIARFSF